MTYRNDKDREDSESHTQQIEKMQEKYFCCVGIQYMLKTTTYF